MRRTVATAIAGLCFLLLLALVIWQGSFDFGTYGPTDFRETVVIWGVSTFIFILTVTLGFMLVRAFVKLYIERQGNKEGSRIRSKLLVGSLALTLTPVLFSVFFSVYALNRNLDHWFSRPAQQIQMNLRDVDAALQRIKEGTFGKCQHCGHQIAEARLLAVPSACYCASCEKSRRN